MDNPPDPAYSSASASMSNGTTGMHAPQLTVTSPTSLAHVSSASAFSSGGGGGSDTMGFGCASGSGGAGGGEGGGSSAPMSSDMLLLSDPALDALDQAISAAYLPQHHQQQHQQQQQQQQQHLHHMSASNPNLLPTSASSHFQSSLSTPSLFASSSSSTTTTSSTHMPMLSGNQLGLYINTDGGSARSSEGSVGYGASGDNSPFAAAGFFGGGLSSSANGSYHAPPGYQNVMAQHTSGHVSPSSPLTSPHMGTSAGPPPLIFSSADSHEHFQQQHQFFQNPHLQQQQQYLHPHPHSQSGLVGSGASPPNAFGPHLPSFFVSPPGSVDGGNGGLTNGDSASLAAAASVATSTSPFPWQPSAHHESLLMASVAGANMPRSNSSPGSSRSASRPESPGNVLDLSGGSGTGPEDRSTVLSRSMSSPVGVHVRALGQSRSRMGSFSSNQKSPLRSGFTPSSPVPAGPATPSSPMPPELDMARMHVEDDEFSPSRSCSPRRSHCSDMDPAEDLVAVVKRGGRGGGVNRASSLPLSTKKPALSSSPRNSPRVSRRSSRIVDINRSSPNPPTSPTSFGGSTNSVSSAGAHGGGGSGAAAAASGVVPTYTASRHSPALQRSSSFSSEHASYPAMEGVLFMHVEPASFGRFRYEAEGRQNCLEGCEPQSFPTVRVAKEWQRYIPDGTVVHVSLIRRHDFQPHHHTLASKDHSSTDQILHGGQASFPSLVVKRQKSAARYPPEDQRSVRLLFTVNFTDKDGQPAEAYCVSRPVFNSDLKITHVSHRSGPANQYTEAIILCSKVNKKTIAIRLSDDPESGFMPPPDAEGWVQGPDGSHVCLLRGNFEVHHQYAILCIIPPFHTPGLTVSQDVVLQLVDMEDETSSNLEIFTYISASYDSNV